MLLMDGENKMQQKMVFHRPYLWPVGRGGLVSPERVVAAGRWASAPIRRLAREAQAQGWLLDFTFGKACCWVIFLDTGHVVLASEPMPAVSMEEFEKVLEAV